MSSRSEQIVQMMKAETPVGKLLLASLQSHAHFYKDSGLFAGLLALE